MKHGFLAELQADLAFDRRAGSGSGTRLVNASVDAVEVTGAGIMLMVGTEHRGTFGSSDAAIAVVEELQFTLGEGPCIDTFRSGRPVLEPHLRSTLQDRWHEFSGPALAAGVEAIFGFPLTVGDAQLGALDLYVDEPGELRPEQFTNALTMADIVAHTVWNCSPTSCPVHSRPIWRWAVSSGRWSIRLPGCSRCSSIFRSKTHWRGCVLTRTRKAGRSTESQSKSSSENCDSNEVRHAVVLRAD